MPQPLQMTRRRLQVFVSSTQADLLEERQEAVETILKAGHIPAGMEHFAADNDSSLDVIKEWIDESDVYMVIVGFRYGSIEPKSGKSFTQVEYEYAVSTGKPVFAVLMTDKWRIAKQKGAEDPASVTERVRPGDLEAFRTLAKQKNVKFVDDRSGIGLAIHESLALFQRKYKLVGWVRGDADDKRQELEKEIARLKETLASMERQQMDTAAAQRRTRTPTDNPQTASTKSDEEWEKLRLELNETRVTITQPDYDPFFGDHVERITTDILTAMVDHRDQFFSGVSGKKVDVLLHSLFTNVAPVLLKHGLLAPASNTTSSAYLTLSLSRKGKEFLVWLDLQRLRI